MMLRAFYHPHFLFQRPLPIRQMSANAESLVEKYTALQSKRLSDPDKELERLQKNATVHARLTKLKTHYQNDFALSYYQPNIFHLIAYGRSLEIFEIFKNTHYVLHHGQSGSGFLALNIIIKMLLDWASIKKSSEFQTVLRHPIDFKNLNSNVHTVEWYKKRIDGSDLYKEKDHLYTSSLIAADGYLASTEQAESALSFFVSNSYRQVQLKKKSLSEIVTHYLLDQAMQKSFINAFDQIDEEAISLGEGVLYTICVPKEYFNECGYLFMPFGIPVEPEEGSESTLEKMQEEQLPGKSLPQVRLLTHKLDPNKVTIFISPTMPDEVYLSVFNKIKALINTYHKHFRVVDTPRPATSSHDPEDNTYRPKR